MRARERTRATPDWSQLLIEAVNTPGTLSTAYNRFWNYSVGNQLMALFECLARRIEPGPIHTFRGWLALGRHVKQGEKAITLCMPVTVKTQRKPHRLEPVESTADTADRQDGVRYRIIFVFKSRWFVLGQTDGAQYTSTEVPDWSESRALRALSIERIPFNQLGGNCQGFARKRQVAVSPIAVLPHKTLFHEMAHVILEHTKEGALDDHDRTPVNIREVEAESVALICCESLQLPGIPECRGYIQHWLRLGQTPADAIPPQSAQKIFRAADMILKAGRPPVQVVGPSESK